VQVVAGEDLRRADAALAARARVARAARDDGGDDDALADEVTGAVACRLDDAADLVSERQRQRVPRAHAVVQEPDVGVAHAAAGDAHQHVSFRERRCLAFDELHRLARGRHLERSDRGHRASSLRSWKVAPRWT
jgi:hypothetical protein